MLNKIIREARRGFYKLPIFQHANALEIEVSGEDWHEIARLSYWGERKPFLRINLPISLITMEGAFHYSNECNPFVAMLNDGEHALLKQYENFQPSNLCEMFRIKPTGLVGEALPVNTLPWVWFSKDRVDSGEMGLGPEHGVSYFGPVSNEKIALEVKRLTETRNSIQNKGYLPDRHGDISGYFLRRDNAFRFKVRGGKHRAAALVHLGWNSLPVRMKEGWPRVIDRAYCHEWPEVQSGRIDVNLAKAVFDRHFDNQSLEEVYSICSNKN